MTPADKGRALWAVAAALAPWTNRQLLAPLALKCAKQSSKCRVIGALIENSPSGIGKGLDSAVTQVIEVFRKGPSQLHRLTSLDAVV